MKEDSHSGTSDIGEQADRLQLESRRRIERTLPCDPVAAFDDVPAPGEGAPGGTIMDIDLSLGGVEPDPEAAEADPFKLDVGFADVGGLEVDLSDVEGLDDL